MNAKRAVTLDAPAKLNLFLDVTRRRPDGYHDLATIFAKISLHDTVSVSISARPVVSLRIKNLSGCPLSAGEDNLACRAARLFLREFGLSRGVSISLVKRIPIGAGLGGGSSDAAAVLRAMAALFPGRASGSAGSKKLLKLALALGSDVPFFMQDGAFCTGRGRGEKLSPFSARGPLPHILLAYPGAPVSTAKAYAALDMTKKRLTVGQNLNRLQRKLQQGVSVLGWGHLLYNRLEDAVLPRYPKVRALVQRLRKAGDFPVLMSGSGSCVFALIPQHKTAVALSGRLRNRNLAVFVVKFLGLGEQ
ncbi:MAG: 4-(cytidine 5'-diphospho)-2-C-methyl-D-erythritol kinase [Elusimicrobia bacterium]|nr:4-(cytidine 5'-diphospho)-2-C-methyl-D-erythritol kinase [Elusimicrobiota bacterium]